MITRAAVATVIARGNVRCGSRVSPAENVMYCHPSYAHNAAMNALAKPLASDGVTDVGQIDAVVAGGRPNAINATAMETSATIFTPDVQFCTVELWRVPRTL